MRVAAILSSTATKYDVLPFETPQAKIEVVEELGSGPWDAALVFGGDGTVHRHLSALRRLQVPLMPVPAGSANDFARELQLTHPRHALEVWRNFCAGQGHVKQVDLGVIRKPGTTEETYFCCSGFVGLDAAATRRANQMPPWMRSHGGYVLAALREMATYKFPRMRVAVEKIAMNGDMRVFDQAATLVVFANSSTYGDGMRMAPRAVLDDGQLDICFVRRTSRARLFTFFPTVFAGKHLSLPEVEYVQAPCLKLETDPVMEVYADGEYVCPTPVEVSVAPGALRVVV